MNRNNQLDFFRGLLLIIITIDHALSSNNVVKRFTDESMGWVSAAEGFVFLSGLTAGIVYSHKANEKGTAFVSKLAIKRARLIYRNHLALFLFVCAAILCSASVRELWSSAAYGPLMEQPLLVILAGSLLVYQPPLLDILPMYALFILFAPFVIKWFQKGYNWYVLLGSFTLYLLGNANKLFNLFNIPSQSHKLVIGFFNLACWQILFLLGLFIGFVFYKGRTKHWQTNNYLFCIALASSAAFFILKNMHIQLPWINLAYATDKATLGPLRLLNFIALCYVAIFIASKKENWFTYRPIRYLGKHSLEVFSFHIVLLVLLLPIKMQFNTIYSVQITKNFYFYPFGTLFVFLCIIPMLFLAPTLLGKTKKPSVPLLQKHSAENSAAPPLPYAQPSQPI